MESDKINRLDGYLRAIDDDTVEEYHNQQDKRKKWVGKECNKN